MPLVGVLDTCIVDFLAGKGIEVDAKPNTKIEASAVALVRANFQDEKAAKEKAVSSSNRAVTERASVTLASARKKPAPAAEPEVELDLSVFQKSFFLLLSVYYLRRKHHKKGACHFILILLFFLSLKNIK